MFCIGSLTFESVVGTCPPHHELAVAWTFVTAVAVLSIGGLILCWIRRRSPLVSKRDWLTAIIFVFVTFLALISAFFDRVIPCWAYYPLNYTLASVIPGTLLARLWGMFARHIRQSVAVNKIPRPLKATLRIGEMGHPRVIKALQQMTQLLIPHSNRYRSYSVVGSAILHGSSDLYFDSE